MFADGSADAAGDSATLRSRSWMLIPWGMLPLFSSVFSASVVSVLPSLVIVTVVSTTDWLLSARFENELLDSA